MTHPIWVINYESLDKTGSWFEFNSKFKNFIFFKIRNDWFQILGLWLDNNFPGFWFVQSSIFILIGWFSNRVYATSWLIYLGSIFHHLTAAYPDRDFLSIFLTVKYRSLNPRPFSKIRFFFSSDNLRWIKRFRWVTNWWVILSGRILTKIRSDAPKMSQRFPENHCNSMIELSPWAKRETRESHFPSKTFFLIFLLLFK